MIAIGQPKLYVGILALIIGVLGFLLVLQGFKPAETIEIPYTMYIEVYQSFPDNSVINMSAEKLDQCPVLKNAVLTLISEQKNELAQNVKASEFQCIDALLKSEAPRPDVTTFYYQGRYFNVAFAID